MSNILAIDQGTTSSRAILFGPDQRPIASAQREFTQHFPRSGWVEHDGEEIWHSVLATAREVLARGPAAAIGITNQRETVLLWDRSGKPLHRAIVWQDRRTAAHCDALKAEGLEAEITDRTGLLLDPYFSATKLGWLLDHLDVRTAAARGDVLFGTIDSWLIWKLTGGAVHATDATNAARTMLFDIRENAWDADICARLDIPMAMLPQVHDCAAEFGTTAEGVFETRLPIRGVAGDQQAATLGQACFEPGMMKSTYGTGCFALLNTGAEPAASSNRLLTTIAYRLDGKTTYALEGSIFIAGAVVQWLRDGMQFIEKSGEASDLASKADPGQRLIMVPAFTGLGAPWWQPEARGAVFGLTRNSGPAEFALAALESVGFQTADLMAAMEADWPGDGQTVLRVDGGMAASDMTMQFLADIIGAPVDRPVVPETTALGAGWLAGMQSGLWPDAEGFAASWALERRFEPQMEAGQRAQRLAQWSKAVQRVLL